MLRNSIAIGMLVAFPAIASAADLVDGIKTINNLLQKIVPIIITITVILFLWGLLKYIMSPDQEKAKERMLYAGLALFVMVAVWGLVGLIDQTLGGGITDTDPQGVDLPGVKFNN